MTVTNKRPAPPKQQFRERYKRHDVVAGYVFILPLMAGILIFYIIPIFQTFYYSLTEWGMFGGTSFVGLKNYERLVKDDYVWHSLLNTLRYTVMLVPSSIILSIFFATLLNMGIRGKSVYRVIYFLPAVTMTTAAALVWKFIFNAEYGPVNALLAKFGVRGPSWTTNSGTAIIVLVVVAVWLGLGKNIILYLAGLQGIPRTYYEAAEIDGAGTFRRFFSITLPLLTPTMFFQMTTTIISSLQLYDTIFVIFKEENPALRSVVSVAYQFYRQMYVFNDKGYAASIAILLLVVTLIITAFNFSMQGKWVNYD